MAQLRLHVRECQKQYNIQVKKTRRGKRAGRNLKERASFESHRASIDSRRGSLDARGSLDLPQPTTGRFSADNPGRPSTENPGRFSTDSQRPSLGGHQVCCPAALWML